MTTSRFFRAIVATAVWGFVAVAPAAAATVTLEWNAVTSPGVTGYQVCASLTPTCAGGVAFVGNPSVDVSGGSQTTASIPLVRAGDRNHRERVGPASLATPVSSRRPGASRLRSDFNGDALADILWQNSVTNQLASWHLSGSNFVTSRLIANSVGAGWKICGERGSAIRMASRIESG